jgi:SAM-dependent methyltransferase
MSTSEVKSPVTGTTRTEFEKNINCTSIIQLYKRQLDIDVDKYFKNLDSISIYKCLDSGFRFYFPTYLEGDSEFYTQLQQYTWYYLEHKWEYEVADNAISPLNKVLEIGCAEGSFLNYLQKKGCESVGLEINVNAITKGKQKGLNILSHTIQTHAVNHRNYYDTVCSFQVLEHIADVKSFMQSSIDVLKKGGILIISVPNHLPNSLLLQDNILDLPPHHIGLWDATSLANLQLFFPLKLDQLIFEPLPKYHLAPYRKLIQNRLIEKLGFKGRVLDRVADMLISRVIRYLADYMIGQTIVAIYTKL